MFVVTYCRKIKPGKEESFRSAWRKATRAIALRYGSLGSRLHQADDGRWVAYAQWPNRECWEAIQSGPPADADAFAVMRDRIDDSDDALKPFHCMTVTDDYLKPMKSPMP